MIVRLLTSFPWKNRTRQVGEIVDLPDDMALAYLRTNQAEEVITPRPPMEAAAIDRGTNENTMRKHSPQFRRR